jgi:multicomponent Na+:H+ antiporter subunit A
LLALVGPLAARRLGPKVFLLCGLAPLAGVVTLAAALPDVLDGRPWDDSVAWLPALDLHLDFRLDAFSALFVVLVSGIGVLIFAYAAAYFGNRPDLGRIAGTLTLFSGAMLGVVLADNLLVLYVCWELTSVTSYLLIGTDDDKGSARAAALQAILVTGGGGLAMLAGFVVLGQAAGTYQISAILADPPGGTGVAVGLVLILAGAFTKSAQVPFHAWLPGAMAAPTPISAYLHSATMVKAGVYLVARLAPAFATSGPWRPLVLTFGLATMLVGGWNALRQHDLKLLLAHGTVSQLGFMVVLLGAGLPDATFAGAAVLLAHGAFKASLFMLVGIIDHSAHTRDIRRLTGLGRRLPVLAAIGGLTAGSMAGLPLLLGFVAKEAAYEAFVHGGLGAADRLVLAGLVVGSILTFAYSARLLWGAFAGKPAADIRDPVTDVHRPSAAFVAPAAFLAAATVVVGVLPALASSLVVEAAQALDPRVHDTYLSLWHGFNEALLLSVVTVAAGTTLFLARRRVTALQARTRVMPDPQAMFQATVNGTLQVADRVTGFVQHGSLPIYLGVILFTAMAVPGVALVRELHLIPGIELAESPLQIPAGLAVALAALGTARAQRRFAAVLGLGATGFGVAVLFMIHGAPDLALTQLLVETLAVVIFVLVLRHLPDRFRSIPWRIGQVPRLLVAGTVGVFAAVFSLVAASARTADPVSDVYVETAYSEAGGRNVVNVILVDFRGFDTLGEITVLVIAALGIITLVRARTRGSDA